MIQYKSIKMILKIKNTKDYKKKKNKIINLILQKKSTYRIETELTKNIFTIQAQ